MLKITCKSWHTSTQAMIRTPLQLCWLLCLLCGAWNLFADLCYIYFYLAHMTFEGFGTIDNTSRPGNLFNFDHKWPLLFAQVSGWMYPVWAVATTYPLYLGLHGAGWWYSWAPCALLAYGLCVVGGALHSGFSFTTNLPQLLHTPQWEVLAGISICASYIHAAQAKVMESYVFGYTPGPPAVIVASLWITYVVATRETRLTKWFILFTPPMTVAWVVAVGFIVIPDPWGKYFVGAFGTWMILVMNMATSWILWNVNEEVSLRKSQ